MQVIRKFVLDIKKAVITRPGLALLIVLLSIISFGIIKPDFYLVGWDNFSSYLNLKSNIFNTIFATWREHRGVGVPSDSEITDIFRQLLLLVLSPIFPNNILDQLYYVCVLWGGVIGMYPLGRYISFLTKQPNHSHELIGFLSAIFYLFNLSTLAVFYFPMTMFVTRFFTLPTTIYALFSLIYSKHITKKQYAFYAFLLLAGTGAYMVATIYVVMMMVLGLMFLFLKKSKRLLIVLMFYVLLNSFWLLPFANYTIQKADIVPKAPTFVIINDWLLNKPTSYFSFENQAKFRPNFFESQFRNNSTEVIEPFHPIAFLEKTAFIRQVLWIFPILYIAGIFFVFVGRKHRIYRWLGATTVFLLIMSMKEYSPLGIVYELITDYVPFARTIFRFGDTKFHGVTAFAGSIIAAYFISVVVSWLHNFANIQRKYIVLLAVVIILIPHLIVFRSYFTGNFVGYFMYNKIPQAYFDMAKIINDDKEYVRVIQLPFDRTTYWKPYSWGYFGSSFFHFMINKPYFDRSFEPASIENSDIHEQFMQLYETASAVPDVTPLDDRARQMHGLLQRLSIKYIIDDGTISPNIDSRNIAYGARINPADSSKLLTHMNQLGLIKVRSTYTIPTQKDIYAKLYPYNKSIAFDYPSREIVLYELTSTHQRIQLLPKIDIVHSSQNILQNLPIYSVQNHYIQSQSLDDDAIIYPFASTLGSENGIDSGTYTSKLPIATNGAYRFSTGNIPQNPSAIYTVYAEKNESKIALNLELMALPTIQNSTTGTNQIRNEVVFNPSDDVTKVKINDQVLSIPLNLAEEEQGIGSIILRDAVAEISLLTPLDDTNVGNSLVQLEANPQCLGDGRSDAKSGITGESGILNINGQNASNCLTTEFSVLPPNADTSIEYAELTFNSAATIQSLDQASGVHSTKPILEHIIQKAEYPLYMFVCVKTPYSESCLNNDQYILLKNTAQNYTLPIIGNLNGIDRYRISFIVKAERGSFKYEAVTKNIYFKRYGTDVTAVYRNNTIHDISRSIHIDESKNMTISIPIAASQYSYTGSFVDQGFMQRYADNCSKQDSQALSKLASHDAIYTFRNACDVYFYKLINYSSDNFYTSIVRYKHLAGTLPSLALNDKFNIPYHMRRLAPTHRSANNYYDVPFQKPEKFWESEDMLSQRLLEAETYAISDYIYPRYDLMSKKSKEMIFAQPIENIGLNVINEISLVELPNYWAISKILREGYFSKEYSTENSLLIYERIIPSLWKITISQQTPQEQLLKFNEGFDKQWKLIGINSVHYQCDGYANCYKLSMTQDVGTFYLFYLPEILNFLGNVIVIISIITGSIILPKKHV